MTEAEQSIQSRLFALQDMGYREFHSKLMPNIDPALVIGVRTPALRKLAASLYGTPEAEAFLTILPHKYYEENNLHGLLIERMRDYESIVARLEAFLPYVDNWATCDLIAPKVFKTHRAALLDKIRAWIASDRTYTIRFGVGMLLRFYLDEDFSPEYLQMVAAIRSEEYYVNMMLAWYFATALAKHWEAAYPYIEQKRLPIWVHNKTIQKAVESYRIDDADKARLRALRVK